MLKPFLIVISIVLLLIVFYKYSIGSKEDSSDQMLTQKITDQPVQNFTASDNKKLINDINFDYTYDSSRIYGSGYFDYRDTLQTYYTGYSIPRDSVYKVYNVKEYAPANFLSKRDPVTPGPYLDRANHFNNIKMYEEAINDYDLYIKANPYNYSGYMNRGTCHERLFHYNLALRDYDKVIELKPNDTIAFMNKGVIYDYLQEYSKAIKEYDTVIIRDRKLAKAYRNRGVSYEFIGNFDLAMKDMEEAIRLNPRYEKVLKPKIIRMKNSLTQ
jgi:tetratricopeptide (TPR) repeat protein